MTGIGRAILLWRAWRLRAHCRRLLEYVRRMSARADALEARARDAGRADEAAHDAARRDLRRQMREGGWDA